jgi:hypothetical protein
LSEQPGDLLAKLVLLNLSARRHGKRLAELQALRQLPGGDAIISSKSSASPG